MADTKINSAGEQQPVDEKSRYAESGVKNEVSGGGVYSSLPDANKIVKNYERRFGKIRQSGAQSGALNPHDPKDRERAEKHAQITYERIRGNSADIPKIAKVSGYSEADIRRIKNHMFFNEYDLDDGVHTFDPDFDQAQSWDRLQNGNPTEADFVMLHHELIEEKLMSQGYTYKAAHRIANKRANYQKALGDDKNARTKTKRN